MANFKNSDIDYRRSFTRLILFKDTNYAHWKEVLHDCDEEIYDAIHKGNYIAIKTSGSKIEPKEKLEFYSWKEIESCRESLSKLGTSIQVLARNIASKYWTH